MLVSVTYSIIIFTQLSENQVAEPRRFTLAGRKIDTTVAAANMPIRFKHFGIQFEAVIWDDDDNTLRMSTIQKPPLSHANDLVNKLLKSGFELETVSPEIIKAEG